MAYGRSFRLGSLRRGQAQAIGQLSRAPGAVPVPRLDCGPTGARSRGRLMDPFQRDPERRDNETLD